MKFSKWFKNIRYKLYLRKVKYREATGEDNCLNCVDLKWIPIETMVYTEEPGCKR